MTGVGFALGYWDLGVLGPSGYESNLCTGWTLWGYSLVESYMYLGGVRFRILGLRVFEFRV